MKKIISILSIFLIHFCYIYSQEKFTDILKNLSVKDKEINVDIDIDKQSDNNYFKLMSKDQNFYFLDKAIIYTNTYNRFSIFSIFSPSIFDEPEDNLLKSIPQLSIVFDKNKRKCYLIKYNQNETVYHNINNRSSIVISSFYYANISSVIELNNRLRPKVGISVITSSVLSDIYEEGNINIMALFLNNKNDYWYETMSLNKALHIQNISYNCLVNIFSRKKSITCFKKNNEKKSNIKVLFTAHEPYFYKIYNLKWLDFE